MNNILHFKNFGKIFLIMGAVFAISGISNANATGKIKITCTKYQWDVSECQSLCNKVTGITDILKGEHYRGWCYVSGFVNQHIFGGYSTSPSMVSICSNSSQIISECKRACEKPSCIEFEMDTTTNTESMENRIVDKVRKSLGEAAAKHYDPNYIYQ